MASSDLIFRLIKSLDRSEKRYFKLYCDLQSGEKNYLKLFDAIDAQPDYDEVAIKQQFADETFVKDLHVTKNYLQNLILKAMRLYREQKTAENQLFGLLQDAEFLERKGLYTACARTLRKAGKLAQNFDLHHLHWDVIRRKINLEVQFNNKNMAELVDQLFDTFSESNDRLVDELTSTRSYYDLFIHSRRKRDAHLQQDIAPPPPLPTDGATRTFRSHYRHVNAWAIYHRLQGDFQQANQYYEMVADLWRGRSKMQKEMPWQYKKVLSNFLDSCHTIKRYDVFPDVIAAIKKIPSASWDEEGETFQNVYHQQLLYLLNTDQFTEAKSIVPEIEQGLEQYGDKINLARQLTFCHNITALFFVTGEYKAANRWVQRIINLPRNSIRLDIQRFARMLRPLLLHLVGHQDLADNALRAAKDYLKRTGQQREFDALMLQFLGEWFNASSTEQKEIGATWITRLRSAPKSVTRSLGCEELVLWLEGR